MGLKKGEQFKFIAPEVLKELYIIQKLPLTECAKRLNLSVGGVWKKLRIIGIDTSQRLGTGRRGKSKGKIGHSAGYVYVYMPEHPRVKGKKTRPYVLEHIVVMEKKIGRFLRPGEVVHHINRNRADNREENLELFPSHAEHVSNGDHAVRVWSRLFERCQQCSTTTRNHAGRGLCSRCYNAKYFPYSRH